MKKLILALSLFSVSVFAQEFSSYTQCAAKTPCFDYYGRPAGVAQCFVVGSAYVSSGDNSNACSWYVEPGVGVRCSGYAQVRNQWGQIVWAWQNYEARCPR
nr:hypothetical protein BHI3_06220 [Bacteriovorax sp. HI3]